MGEEYGLETSLHPVPPSIDINEIGESSEAMARALGDILQYCRQLPLYSDSLREGISSNFLPRLKSVEEGQVGIDIDVLFADLIRISHLLYLGEGTSFRLDGLSKNIEIYDTQDRLRVRMGVLAGGADAGLQAWDADGNTLFSATGRIPVNLNSDDVTGVLQVAHIDANVQNVIPVWGGAEVEFDSSAGNKIYIFELSPGLKDLLPNIPGAENFTADYIEGIGEPTAGGAYGVWGIPYDKLVTGTNQAVPTGVNSIFIDEDEKIEIWRNGVGTKIFMKPEVVGNGGTIHNILAIKNPAGTGTSTTSLTVASITTTSTDADYIFFRVRPLGEKIASRGFVYNFNLGVAVGAWHETRFFTRLGKAVNYQGAGVPADDLSFSLLTGAGNFAQVYRDEKIYSFQNIGTGRFSKRVRNVDTGSSVTTEEWTLEGVLAFSGSRSVGTMDDTYLYVWENASDQDSSDLSKILVFRVSDGAREQTRDISVEDRYEAKTLTIAGDYIIAWGASGSTFGAASNRVYRISDKTRQTTKEFTPDEVQSLYPGRMGIEDSNGDVRLYFFRDLTQTAYVDGLLWAASSTQRVNFNLDPPSSNYVNGYAVIPFQFDEIAAPTSVPAGDNSDEDNLPTNWSREVPAKNSGRIFRARRTRTYQNERFLSATDFGSFSEITGNFTIFQYLWRRSATTPDNPSGGTTTEDHEPTNFSRTRLLSTSTLGVYRWRRTATYSGEGAFVSATAWGSRTQTAPPSG